MASFSVPVFVVGYILFLRRAAMALAAGGATREMSEAGIWLSHLVLPSLALGLAYVALIAHHARQHARGAVRGLHPHRQRAKGVATGRCLRHALQNAAVPIVTVVASASRC